MPATDVSVLSLASMLGESAFTCSQPDELSGLPTNRPGSVVSISIDGKPVLDATAFPIVAMRAAAHLGYAFAWGASMRALVERRTPFVLIDHGAIDETDDDRQARRCLVRAHAADLSRYCYGLIAIEADIARRCTTRAQAASLVEAANLRVVVVSGAAVAQQLADVLLRAEKPVGAVR